MRGSSTAIWLVLTVTLVPLMVRSPVTVRSPLTVALFVTDSESAETSPEVVTEAAEIAPAESMLATSPPESV